jgi:hypothetical protein
LAEPLTAFYNGLDRTLTNDFYDREILVYGLSYSTIFAACDGWIESLVTLSREARYPGVFEFSKNLDELSGLIEKLATTYKQP